MKSDLRRHIHQIKLLYTAAQLKAYSEVIWRRLMQHPRLMEARTVLLYASMPGEVETMQAIAELTAMGKTVILPRVTGRETMDLCVYRGHESLKSGTLGILEPTGEPFTAYSSIDVALVPGMAFDAEGHRLGRGRGYYDRLLKLLPNTYKIGVCFPFQVVDSVPVNDLDVLMNEIISF